MLRFTGLEISCPQHPGTEQKKKKNKKNKKNKKSKNRRSALHADLMNTAFTDIILALQTVALDIANNIGSGFSRYNVDGDVVYYCLCAMSVLQTITLALAIRIASGLRWCFFEAVRSA